MPAEDKVPLITLEGGEYHAKKTPSNSSSESMQCDAKLAAFVIVGVLTLLYVVAELGVAIYLDSLVLLSDGFHNLSDVVSLYIAFWARRATKRSASEDMSYGWARSEILGGLTNGCFLLSLCLYVVLEAIPKFIRPIPIASGLLFMIIAGSGLAINTFGTILFALTGQEAHHGHSHSHGHDHGHSHKEKKKQKKDVLELVEGNGHVEKDHDHDHDHKDHNDHDHHDHDDHDHDGKKKEKRKKKNTLTDMDTNTKKRKRRRKKRNVI